MLNNYELKIFNELFFKAVTEGRKLQLRFYDFENVFSVVMPDTLVDYMQEELKNGGERLNFLKKILNRNLNQLKNARKSRLQRKFEIFCELLNLSEVETAVLRLKLYDKILPEFDDLFNAFNRGKFKTPKLSTYLIRFITGQNEVDISTGLNSLVQKGILITQEYELTDNIQSLFLNSEIYKKKDLSSYLLNDTQRTHLKKSDFKYLEREINKVEAIIDNALSTRTKGINILFWGNVGTGKTELAKVIAKTLKKKLYAVNTADSYGRCASLWERMYDYGRKLRLLMSYNDSFLLFDEAEDVMNESYQFARSNSKSFMNKILEENDIPVIWTTNNIENVDQAFLRRMTYAVEFKELSNDTRLNIWKKEVAKNKIKIDAQKLVELNDAYDIPPALITNAIRTTKLTNGTSDDFEQYVQNVSKLINRGQDIKVSSSLSFANYNSGLVNTDIDIDNLTERIARVGKLNFSLCLYGQSGTGKSAYARHLAKQLGIKVVVKQASDLMSSYIGETEKNIARAFEAAKTQKAMLIIDEADTFLQSRQTAVRSWEISQVNQMLTSMENHPYPFVCTTNLVDILDEACLRRFTFKIKFNFLNKAQVKKAFRHFFNLNAPDELINLYGLTLGDFAVANKKAEYLDCKTNALELTNLLKDEVKMKSKDAVGQAIGF